MSQPLSLSQGSNLSCNLSQNSSIGFNLSQKTFEQLWENNLPNLAASHSSNVQTYSRVFKEEPGVSGKQKERYEFFMSRDNFRVSGDSPVIEQLPPPTYQAVSQHDPFGIPSNIRYPGPHNFHMKYPEEKENESKSIAWTYSSVLERYFCKRRTAVPMQFIVDNGSGLGGAVVRMLPIFKQPEDIRDPIKRCPNDMQRNEDGHCDPRHAFMSDYPGTRYEMVGDRPCMVIPFEPNEIGEAVFCIRCACFSSCLGGRDRKVCQLIFTLEIEGIVIGRDIVDARICASPGRDKTNHVAKFLREEGEGSSRSKSRCAVSSPVSSFEENGDEDESKVVAPVEVRETGLIGCLSSAPKRPCLDGSLVGCAGSGENEEGCDNEEDHTLYSLVIEGKETYLQVLQLYESLKTLKKISKVCPDLKAEVKKEIQQQQISYLPQETKEISQQSQNQHSFSSGSDEVLPSSQPRTFEMTRFVLKRTISHPFK